MRKPLGFNHIALVPFAALVLAACQDTPTQTALDGESPYFAINAGNPTGTVTFGLAGVLDEAEMRRLNYLVDVEKQHVKDVAAQFLKHIEGPESKPTGAR